MALTLDENPPELYIDDVMVPVDSDVGPLPVLGSGVGGYNWFVAETKARAEKSLARNLLAKQIRYFLPYAVRRTSSRNRVYSPMLPGYVFVATPPDQSAAGVADAKEFCLSTRTVWNFIDARDQRRLRLDLLALAVRGAATEEVLPALLPGLTVRVISGDLKGLVGTILSTDKDGRIRVLLDVQLLSQPISVPIQSETLEPVNDGLPV